MTHFSLKISPALVFNLELNSNSLQVLHRGLSWAKEHGSFPPEDPIYELSDQFNKILLSLVDNESMLASMGLDLKLDIEPVIPNIAIQDLTDSTPVLADDLESSGDDPVSGIEVEPYPEDE